MTVKRHLVHCSEQSNGDFTAIVGAILMASVSTSFTVRGFLDNTIPGTSTKNARTHSLTDILYKLEFRF